MTLAALLLAVHIAAGTAALLAGLLALLRAKGRAGHRRAGRVFAVSLALGLASALGLALLRPNPFLLTIALFSGYLLATGWRRALRRRASGAGAVDWGLAAAMGLLAAGMLWVGGGWLAGAEPFDLAAREASQAAVLLAFGGLGLGFALADLRCAARGGGAGTARIVQHGARMGGAFIATVTAVAVVNLSGLPELLVWLGPSALLSPLLAWVTARALRAAPRSPGAPAP